MSNPEEKPPPNRSSDILGMLLYFLLTATVMKLIMTPTAEAAKMALWTTVACAAYECCKYLLKQRHRRD